MILHKVLEIDKERIIRFCLAEDPDLIAIFKTGTGNGLDSAVSNQLSLIATGSNLFKVETDTGAIVGYFTTSINSWELNGFIIRKTFRAYPAAVNLFFDLISCTFENNLFFSIGADNFTTPNYLTNNYTITNTTFYSNKNYLLLTINNT